MEYNEGLLELLNNDPRVYRDLWDKWKQINPDTRLNPVNGNLGRVAILPELNPTIPVRANRKGKRAALWRFAGRLFRHKRWFERGRCDEMPTIPEHYTQTIHLERLGWSDGFERVEIAAAYHAASDTLYFRKLR